jgi:FtsZ-binding cell division protein ZapB
MSKPFYQIFLGCEVAWDDSVYPAGARIGTVYTGWVVSFDYEKAVVYGRPNYASGEPCRLFFLSRELLRAPSNIAEGTTVTVKPTPYIPKPGEPCNATRHNAFTQDTIRIRHPNGAEEVYTGKQWLEILDRCRELEGMHEKFHANIEKDHAVYRAKCEELNKLQQQFQTQAETIANFQRTCRELADERDRLEKGNICLQHECDMLKAEAQRNECEFRNVFDERAFVQQECDKLKEDLGRLSQEKERLKEVLGSRTVTRIAIPTADGGAAYYNAGDLANLIRAAIEARATLQDALVEKVKRNA